MGKIYDYTEGKDVPKRPFLDDEEYEKSIRVQPNPCLDCLLIDGESGKVLFPERVAKTGKGYWFIGGVWKSQGDYQEQLKNIFERETSLSLEADRFIRVKLEDENGIPPRTMWPTGRNDLHYIFKIELNKEEIEQVKNNLDPKEYNQEVGLRDFTLEELKKETRYDILVDAVELALKKETEKNDIYRETKNQLR